jgi:MoaA/NifB/PqqE/SkfB family radical SAM enzyme
MISKNITADIPNPLNFCGGNFQDWLEVNLIDTCNGKCMWCIEKDGFHPSQHADWKDIAVAILETNKKNIILLGGEPTLYKDLRQLCLFLTHHNRFVWITTNGSLITEDFIKKTFLISPPTINATNSKNKITKENCALYGMNISIHHYNLHRNSEITGINIDYFALSKAIKLLKEMGVKTRLNCNCINGEIDNLIKIYNYIFFAKNLGVDKVRFAELKMDKDKFVDLAKILKYQYGLNDDPFKHGCNHDAIVMGMPVNFRQMCGLQSKLRPRPENPKQYKKQVLYYDGKIYNGWQTKQEMNIKETKMDKTNNKQKILEIIKSVKNNSMSVETAIELIDPLIKHSGKLESTSNTTDIPSSSGCVY